MSDMKKSLCLRAGLGFLLGLLTGCMFMLLWKVPEVCMGMTGRRAIILCMIFCGIYGAACMGGTIFYRIDHYSIIRATASHLAVVLAGLFFLGLSIGWRIDEKEVWLIVASYFLGFFLIWLIVYLYGKRRVRRMNDNLKRWKLAHAESKEPH